MNRLIGDLLTLSRVEALERAQPKDRVDWVSIIALATPQLEMRAKAQGVTLVFDMPPAAQVLGDADQLTQLVANLAENAIKYGGKHVTISLRDTDRDVPLRKPAWILEVADTGPGIAPDHIHRLTERFFRIDAHRNRDQGGTGLGLAIAKHIAQRHRGRLQIESVLGQGSQFLAILPKAP